jgi:hypothetical protein
MGGEMDNGNEPGEEDKFGVREGENFAGEEEQDMDDGEDARDTGEEGGEKRCAALDGR